MCRGTLRPVPSQEIRGCRPCAHTHCVQRRHGVDELAVHVLIVVVIVVSMIVLPWWCDPSDAAFAPPCVVRHCKCSCTESRCTQSWLPRHRAEIWETDSKEPHCLACGARPGTEHLSPPAFSYSQTRSTRPPRLLDPAWEACEYLLPPTRCNCQIGPATPSP